MWPHTATQFIHLNLNLHLCSVLVLNENTAVCMVAEKLIWILYLSNSEPFFQTGILEEGIVFELLHTSCKPVHKPQRKQTDLLPVFLMPIHQHPALSLLRETC